MQMQKNLSPSSQKLVENKRELSASLKKVLKTVLKVKMLLTKIQAGDKLKRVD